MSILFDIGGTSMRMAVGKDGIVSQVQKIPTPEYPKDAIAELIRYRNEVSPESADAYGGIAGVIEDGVVRSSPHLPGWNGFPFAEALRMPGRIQNDAELAALGEATYGAGKGYGLVAYLGIGTGIGGANINHGEVAPHASGFEPGHQVLDVEKGDTFEGLVSGHALEKRFGTPAHELPREIYDALTPTLAAGIYNVLLAWSPEVLVLGGSLMDDEDGYRLADIEEALARIPSVLPELPPLKKALLGDECGLYGALALSA